jgi:hypothetical protein
VQDDRFIWAFVATANSSSRSNLSALNASLDRDEQCGRLPVGGRGSKRTLAKADLEAAAVL